MTPAKGGATIEYVIRSGPYPKGSITDPTVVLVEVRDPDGKFAEGGLLHATLAPGESSLVVAFHDPLPPQEPARSPLAPGRYTVHVEDEGHTCVADTTFVVEG